MKIINKNFLLKQKDTNNCYLEEKQLKPIFILPYTLQKRSREKEAKDIHWQVFERYRDNADLKDAIGARGGYWASRSLLVRAEILESEGKSDKAIELYELVIDLGMPGRKIATERMKRHQLGKEKQTDAAKVKPIK